MSVPGGPTQQEIARFSRPGPDAGVSYKYETVNPEGSRKANEYPIVPFAPDSYDTIASIKQQVGDNDTTAYGQKWMVPFTDADAQYILRQQAQAKNAAYERWLWNQYDTNDPAQAWIFQQIAPEQFEKRKTLILHQQNLATRYALLRLYGVKNEEDLMLKYLVETKQVELPEGPVWDPQKWMNAQEQKANQSWVERYTAGFFSPLKLYNQNQIPHYGSTRQDPMQKGAKMDYVAFQGAEAKNKMSLPGNYGNNFLGKLEYYEKDKGGMGLKNRNDYDDFYVS